MRRDYRSIYDAIPIPLDRSARRSAHADAEVRVSTFRMRQRWRQLRHPGGARSPHRVAAAWLLIIAVLKAGLVRAIRWLRLLWQHFSTPRSAVEHEHWWSTHAEPPNPFEGEEPRVARLSLQICCTPSTPAFMRR